MTGWLLAATLLGFPAGYVIRREIEYRRVRPYLPLMLTPPTANTRPPTMVDGASYRDEWKL